MQEGDERAEGDATYNVKKVRHLTILHADCDWNSQVQSPTVDVGLHFVTLEKDLA